MFELHNEVLSPTQDQMCYDLDECQTDNGGCDSNAPCVNTIVRYCVIERNKEFNWNFIQDIYAKVVLLFFHLYTYFSSSFFFFLTVANMWLYVCLFQILKDPRFDRDMYLHILFFFTFFNRNYL